MEHQPLFEALTTALNSLDSAFKSRVDDITPLGLIHPRAVRADREDQLRNRYTTLGLQHLQLCQLEEKLRKLRVFVFRQQTLCTDALAAVSMLPQEVLCHIFRYVSQLDPASVHKIARVNREWRKAVHNDPKLWQGITIYGDRLNRLGNAIMRSPLSYTPFSLRIADPGELIIPPNLVLALQSRLRKVEFLSSNSAAIMEALNRQVDDSEEGLSALESLTIDIPKTCSTCHVDDSRRAISQMALTGIRMPRLTSLNLRRCWVNLPSTLTMQHLTVLDAFESDRQLRNLLVSCPNLVSLRVRGLRARDSSMHHIERIVLPQLRTLEVSAASRYAAHVLWQFSAPNLREFALVNAKVRSAAFAQDFEDHEFGGDSGLLEQFRVLVNAASRMEVLQLPPTLSVTRPLLNSLLPRVDGFVQQNGTVPLSELTQLRIGFDPTQTEFPSLDLDTEDLRSHQPSIAAVANTLDSIIRSSPNSHQITLSVPRCVANALSAMTMSTVAQVNALHCEACAHPVQNGPPGQFGAGGGGGGGGAGAGAGGGGGGGGLGGHNGFFGAQGWHPAHQHHPNLANHHHLLQPAQMDAALHGHFPPPGNFHQQLGVNHPNHALHHHLQHPHHLPMNEGDGIWDAPGEFDADME